MWCTCIYLNAIEKHVITIPSGFKTHIFMCIVHTYNSYALVEGNAQNKTKLKKKRYC